MGLSPDPIGTHAWLSGRRNALFTRGVRWYHALRAGEDSGAVTLAQIEAYEAEDHAA